MVLSDVYVKENILGTKYTRSVSLESVSGYGGYSTHDTFKVTTAIVWESEWVTCRFWNQC